jgi:hypothetical protein
MTRPEFLAAARVAIAKWHKTGGRFRNKLNGLQENGSRSLTYRSSGDEAGAGGVLESYSPRRPG